MRRPLAPAGAQRATASVVRQDQDDLVVALCVLRLKPPGLAGFQLRGLVPMLMILISAIYLQV